MRKHGISDPTFDQFNFLSQNDSISKASGVFEISQVPFAFEFESERPNTNAVTKKLPNYHLTVGLTFPRLTNDNSMTVLSTNCHSAEGT